MKTSSPNQRLARRTLALLLAALGLALPAPAAEFIVGPGHYDTLQAAVDAAADPANLDAQNVIVIAVPVLHTGAAVQIGWQFNAGRQLVIRPDTTGGLRRASIVSENGSEPIVLLAGAGHVTLQDLDLVRHTTNNDDLLQINSGTSNVVERCRIGSDWPAPGAAGWSHVRIDSPVGVLVRNCVCFALLPGTLDRGITVTTGTAQNHSIFLYNNTVADFRLYGIDITGDGSVFVLLRNNVVVNGLSLDPEPITYHSHVDELVEVVTSHNTAFASAANVELLDVIGGGNAQSIAGVLGFLRLERHEHARAFREFEWKTDQGWNQNRNLWRLIDGGLLHNIAADAGVTVTDGVPHGRDVAVREDWERDARPGGDPARTDRGADQITLFFARDIEVFLPGIPSFSGASLGDNGPDEFEVVAVGPQEDLPVIDTAMMSGGEFQVAGEFVAVTGEARGRLLPSRSIGALPMAQLEVRLNQLYYRAGDAASPALFIHGGQLAAPELGLVLVAPQSHDLEVLTVTRADNGARYAAAAGLIVSASNPGGAVTKLDGQLSLQPNETFFAFYYPDPNRDQAVLHGEQIVADFGIMTDPSFDALTPVVAPELALTADELQPPPGALPVGTVMPAGGLPVRIATDELIIHPRDDGELAEFLQATGGQVVLTDLLPGERTTRLRPSLYLVRVNPALARVDRLPQMLSLFQKTPRPLLASSPDALRICALALEHRLQGRRVGVNPRLQWMDRPRWDQGRGQPLRDRVSDSFRNVLLQMPKAWSFMALWDRDTNTVPVAFLDQGFSTNSDFRTPLQQCDMTAGSLLESGEVEFVCGGDSAIGPPTTGASFFGDRVWHGNGVVTVAGGIINNGYGSAGTGGQVVVPMLYRYDASAYVFEIGLGIRRAVLDGAAVINISAGYPCRIVSELGVSFGVCDTAGQVGFCVALETYLTVAAGEACAEAALISAIPLVGPFIADNLACGEANLLVAAAPLACVGLLAAGDVRGPMEEAVAFAVERGVPIVASAGNVIPPSVLPESVRGFVNLDNTRVEDWQIVPASIDGVICVGAAENPDPAILTWQNAHFHGDRVDVWAPTPSFYYAPPGLDAIEPDPDLHERESLSGTSAAAPYIAGLVADVMALNPALNPLNPALTVEGRRAIPQAIRDLLVNTAWTRDELENLLGVVDPTGRRRNLVRPVETLRAAAQGLIPDLAGLGYDRSVNFCEYNDASGHDAKRFARSLGVLNVNRTHTGTILTIPRADPSGTRFGDADWYSFTLPPNPPQGEGLYRGYVQVITPDTNLWGRVTLDGDGFERVEFPHDLPPSAGETLREWRSPLYFNGATRTFRIHREDEDDNVFIVRGLAAVREADLPVADRFDQDDPAVNPPESLPANDDQDHAVHLGDAGGIEWQTITVPGEPNPEASSITVGNLNFHRFADVDWFEQHTLPPFEFYSGAPGCRPMLEISWTGPLTLQVVAPDGRELFGGITSPTRVPSEFVVEGTAFWFKPIDPGEFIQYSFEVRFLTPPPLLCELGEFFGGQDGDGWMDPFGSGGAMRFPGVATFETDVTALAGIRRGFVELRRELDANGLVITPDLYLVEWRGGGEFRVVAALVQGDSIRLTLLDTLGHALAVASLGGPVPASAGEPLRDVFGRRYVVLGAPGLAPGNYVLALSHGRPGTLLDVFPPTGAASGALPTSEQFFAELVPSDSPPEPGLPATRPVVLSAVTRTGQGVSFTLETERGVLYQIEYAESLAQPQWTVLQAVEGSGQPMTVTDMPGAIERWYRVRIE